MSLKTSLYIIICMIFISCNSGKKNQNSDNKNSTEELIIFHAGSLTVPIKEISDAFIAENKNIRILTEAAGSRSCARKISDLHRPCDIMASADYTVIDQLLIPEFADWNVKFATNEMSIAFTNKSKYSDQIDSKNFMEILSREDVFYGRSDPNADPCGYRTVLVTQLAERHLGENGISEILLSKDNRFIRPKEVDLLALLESHAIDYIFIYRSVAEQHNLPYLILPDKINLKSDKYAEFYKTAKVDVTGKKPGETITKFGEPMIYGVTIPKNSPNPELAKKFIQFLLDKNKGLILMGKNGQPPVFPPQISGTKIPESLKLLNLKD